VPLTPSTVLRTDDAGGKTFRVLDDGAGNLWQVIALGDEDGAQAGIASNPLAVSVASLPLPTGAATEATLASILSALGGTLAVSVASLPLPAGAATEATLATLATEATLSAVSGKLPASVGAKTAIGSLSVVLASDHGALPLPTGAATEATLASVDAALAGTLAVSAASLPLPAGAATEATLASVDAALAGTLAVSAASLPLPTGAATEATLASLLTELQGKADLGETQPVSAASLPLPTGAATEATLSSVDSALAGTLTVQPDTSTATSEEAVLAFGDINATFTEEIDPSGPVVGMIIQNSLDQPVEISIDNGSSTFITVLPRKNPTIDLEAIGRVFSDDVHVRYLSAAPTEGTLVITLIE